MTQDLVDRVAAAVLYEGYLLYPYRASAVKNRQRFSFGVLTPQDYSIAQSGTEAWMMQIECLVVGDQPKIHARTRFLHLSHRQVVQIPANDLLIDSSVAGIPTPVEVLEVEDRLYQTWQEAVEREIASPELTLTDLVAAPHLIPFEFGPAESVEIIRASNNDQVGRLIRTQQQIRGMLSLEAVRIADDLHRLRISIFNNTQLPNAETLVREQALPHSFASTHAIFNVKDGTFVSQIDPLREFSEAAAACKQVGCWPVLVGEIEDRRTMLASPIILYDYPQIAAESAGDFFDGTEIDEMLMLRVMTMTPEEHREMRHVDEQARRLLERTQTLPQEDMLKLHGTFRGLHAVNPASSAAEEQEAMVKS